MRTTRRRVTERRWQKQTRCLLFGIIANLFAEDLLNLNLCLRRILFVLIEQLTIEQKIDNEYSSNLVAWKVVILLLQLA